MLFLDERYCKWDTMEEIRHVNSGTSVTATAASAVQPLGWLNW